MKFTYTILVSLASLGSLLAAEPISFRSQIAPILVDNCVSCHGAKKAEGGYRIDTFEYLMRAGDSGDVPVVASKPEESELWRRVVAKDHTVRMPADSEPLAANQIELLKGWIAGGAIFDGESKTDLMQLVIPPTTYPDPPAKYTVPVPASALAVTPDGTQVVVGGYHELTCWNAADGKLIRRIKNIQQRTYAIAVSPDGTRMAVAGGTPGKLGEIRIVELATGNVLGVCGRTTDVVLDVAFSPDGTRLACGGADGLIRIIDAATNREVRVIASHADWVNAVAWSDDGKKLASASRDKSAKAYTVDSGELLTSYAGHGAAVKGVAFLADGLQVLSVGDDKKLHRWEIEAAKKVAEVAFGGDGFKIIRGNNLVYIPCSDKQVHRIDLSNNQATLKYVGQEDWVVSSAFHAASGQLVSGSIKGDLKLWTAADGTLLRGWSAMP
jgi:Planctomycete cytochrome C/WD domain, G-beta repeat/WD40-like Beta Propeller Repeat